MSEPNTKIDKRQARRAFSKAAESYDDVAVLQQEVGQRMLDRMQWVKIEPQRIVDLGAGTGVATAALADRYQQAEVIALDFALPMLQRPQLDGLGRICGDLEQTPFADDSVDLIYSNLALQWSNDLEQTFRELRRILRPGGLLMFSTFGPDTLQELRAAWGSVDGGSHVSSFLDMHTVGDMLLQAGLAEPVMDVDRMTLTYDRVDGLMRDLKILGAHNVTVDRQRGLTGKGRMAAMQQAYEQFRVDGVLPASYEVVYGHAWAPQQNSVTVSLDDIR